jgi:tetratricopeptide (TPR) repeat protein
MNSKRFQADDLGCSRSAICPPAPAATPQPVSPQANLLLSPSPDEAARLALLAELEKYQQEVDRDPNYGWAWYKYGAALMDLDRPAEAVPALRKTAELKTEPSHLHYMLGQALSDLGQLEEAKSEYARVVDKDPELRSVPSLISLSAMTNLALLQERLGQPDEAIQTLLPALREAVGILFNLAFLHYRAKRYELSLPYIHAAYLLKPNNGDILHQYGATLNIVERPREALKILKRATELKPHCDSVWYDLGLAHAVLKQRRPARNCFLKSLEIDPKRKWSYYDLACLDALEGDRAAAFRRLMQAVAYGFRDVKHLRQDKNLRSLHRDKRWKTVVTTIHTMENSKN